MKSKYFIFIMLILLTNSVLAELEITKEPITEVVIKEINNPAVFNFNLKNLGESDNFEIYSLVGVDFTPKGTFYIASGESQNLEVEVFPDENLREEFTGYLQFEYKIKGQKTGIQVDNMLIQILPLKDMLLIRTHDIKIGDEKAIITIKNREKNSFPNLDVEFTSSFFTAEKSFSLGPLEEKNITVDINKPIIGLFAGEYTLTANFKIEDKTAIAEGRIIYSEEPGIKTEEKDSGFFIRLEEIEKINNGNLPILTQASIKKNIISRLFTSFTPAPDYSERAGFSVYYVWQKEIQPGQSLKIQVKTNWLYPVVIVIIIVILIFLFKLYLTTSLLLTKKVGFVRTKGGEFALKVTINLKARKYIENIRIEDKLPPLVKIYERFGANPPDKIDEKNKRLEWNFSNLNSGEVRVLSYVIYSKVGVLGRFTLPQTTAIYERNGKIKEAVSNKAMFISEQKTGEE